MTINVTRPYLPDRKRLDMYLDGIYERAHLTNNGPLLQELTARLEDYLGVENLLVVSNGTLAIQIAAKILGIRGEVITTPFTFAATATALSWEGAKPVFADIDPATLNLDADEVRIAMTRDTGGIVPVHVYGNPCDTNAFEALAKEKDVPLLYDAAHAFGVSVDGRSVLGEGDASTLSFHATKLFHTVEGGAIVFKRSQDKEQAERLINFGLEADGQIHTPGINAKMDEVRAAFGLCGLDDIQIIIEKRLELMHTYDSTLADVIQRPARAEAASQNGTYYPVLFENCAVRDKVIRTLVVEGIYPRIYFSPALCDTPAYKDAAPCVAARNAADRILCLPLYVGLTSKDVELIARLVRTQL